MLRAVADSLATAISTNKCHHKPKTIMFLRAGEKPNTPSRAKSGLLTFATDWQLEVDLGKQLKFPSRQLIMLELTVPLEERMD